MDNLACFSCAAPDAEILCEQCGQGCCLACYRCYEVPYEMPRLCWPCQAEADQEWLKTDLTRPPRRGPRTEAPR